VDTQNVYDSAYFGAPVEFRDGQVPDVSRILEGADRERIFSVDLDRPMDNPFVRECLRRHEELTRAADGVGFHNVRLGVAPVVWGFDGPLTVATNLRGSEFYLDLADDPDYATRAMEFITRGVIIRNRAMRRHFGLKAFDGPSGSIADDSVELISTEMYRRMVLPHHRTYLSQWSVEGPHSMHLCGDATRHFRLIRDELHVNSFDTGFPVDHGALRKALGPGVVIQGGPEVTLLRDGMPEAVYERTRGILQSGVMEGGRFILREANNLPPGCPAENLAAMYRACLEHGRYPDTGSTADERG
jgi:uroporphyrinogen-III decarboxylase